LRRRGLLDDRHDLSPVLVVAVTLGMVLHPAIEELGGPLGKTVLLNQPGGRLLWCLSQAEPISCVTGRRFLCPFITAMA
jgi:hypothetical protein